MPMGDRFVQVSNTCYDAGNCPQCHLDFYVGSSMGNHDGIWEIEWQYIDCEEATARFEAAPMYNRRRQLKEHAAGNAMREQLVNKRRMHTTSISSRKVMMAHYLA